MTVEENRKDRQGKAAPVGGKEQLSSGMWGSPAPTGRSRGAGGAEGCRGCRCVLRGLSRSGGYFQRSGMMEALPDNASSALPSSPPRGALSRLRQMRLMPGSGTRAAVQRGAVQPCMAGRGGAAVAGSACARRGGGASGAGACAGWVCGGWAGRRGDSSTEEGERRGWREGGGGA